MARKYLNISKYLTTNNKRSKKKYKDCLAILDAGHGGMIYGRYVTPGKRSPVWEDGSQYFEGVGNREQRVLIKLELHKLGIPYVDLTTGNEDTPLYLRSRKSNEISRKHGVSKTLLYSIHSNAASSDKAHGLEFFTSKGKTKADMAATLIAMSFKKYFPEKRLRVDMSDGDIDKESNLHITRETICPAVLGEHFFHSNKDECQNILQNKDQQVKIAKAVAEGIRDYFDWLLK